MSFRRGEQPPAKHKIQRLKVVIETNDKAYAHELQNQFSDLCRNQVKTLLDKQFSALSSDDEIVRIDKLELDLGQFKDYLDRDKLLRELPDKLETALRQSKQMGLASISPANVERPTNTRDGGRRSPANGWENEQHEQSGIDDWESHRDSDDEFDQELMEQAWYEESLQQDDDWQTESLTRITESEPYGTGTADSENNISDGEALLLFLRTGQLPWWSQDDSGDEVNRLMRQLTAEDADELLQLMQSYPEVLSRIAWQFDARRQAKLIDILSTTEHNMRMLRFINVCHQRLGNRSNGSNSSHDNHGQLVSVSPFIVQSWQQFIHWLNLQPTPRTCFQGVLEQWRQQPDFLNWRGKILTLASRSEVFANQGFEELIDLLEQQDESVVSSPVAATTKASENITLNAAPEILPIDAFPETLCEVLMISNAGLFLLFGSLPELFSKLNWLVGDGFVSAACQQQAIHLLDYMVWGEAEDESISNDSSTEIEAINNTDITADDSQWLVPESRLNLNKLLCGLQCSEPVWGDCRLPQEVKVQADNTVRQVISALDKLADMDIATFRDSFLQRHGLLSVKDNAWLLRIEPEGRDLLLSSQISPLTHLCFPWMPFALNVEWNSEKSQPYQI